MRLFKKKRNRYDSLNTLELKGVNGKIDSLLFRDLVDTSPETVIEKDVQPENSIRIEPEEEPLSTGPSVPVSAPKGAGIDKLYDSVKRLAEKHNTTFDHVLEELLRQLPGVAKRRKEQLEALVMNPLYSYVRVEKLAKDLHADAKHLADIERQVFTSIKRGDSAPKVTSSQEERQIELVFLKMKNLINQGFKPHAVREALRLSEGMFERLMFRWNLEQKQQKL